MTDAEYRRKLQELATARSTAQSKAARLFDEATEIRETMLEMQAFRDGAEAMRTAILQRVSWGSDLADRIRNEPVPEYEP